LWVMHPFLSRNDCGALMDVVASAPAKIILFGEHFVVYGEPAIVMAIDKRAYATASPRKDKHIRIEFSDLNMAGTFINEHFEPEKCRLDQKTMFEPIQLIVQKVSEIARRRIGVNVKIHSSIPVAAGLGSSAAIAVATTKAISRLFNADISQDMIYSIALEAERLIHGTPSGIDPAISTYGGILKFQRGKGFTPLKVKENIRLVVGNTHVQRSTKDMVSTVREKYETYPSIVKPIIKAGGKLSLLATLALAEDNLQKIGELMNINHALLYAIGVSSEPLEKLVYAARKAGAYGAKLTGAGGGGCIIALPPQNRLDSVAKAIKDAGGTAFIAEKTDEGAKFED